MYNCKLCNKIFQNKNNLKKHLDKPVKCNEIIQCPDCNQKFKTQYNLTRHLNKKDKCVKKNIKYNVTNIDNVVDNEINNGIVNEINLVFLDNKILFQIPNDAPVLKLLKLEASQKLEGTDEDIDYNMLRKLLKEKKFI